MLWQNIGNFSNGVQTAFWKVNLEIKIDYVIIFIGAGIQTLNIF